MKVATSLPIAQHDEQGLPSLLSSVSGEIDTPLGKPTAPNERSNVGSPSPKETASFDTVLAMFGIDVKVPPQQQPQLSTPTTTIANDNSGNIVRPVSLEPAPIRIVRSINQPILPEPLAGPTLPIAQQPVVPTVSQIIDVPVSQIDVPITAPLDPSETRPTLKKTSSDQILLGAVHATMHQPLVPINNWEIRPASVARTTPDIRLTPTPNIQTAPETRPTTDTTVSGIRSTPDYRPILDPQTGSDIRTIPGDRLIPEIQTAPETQPTTDTQPVSGIRSTPDFRPTSDSQTAPEIQRSSPIQATADIRVTDEVPARTPDTTEPNPTFVDKAISPIEIETSDLTKSMLVQQDAVPQGDSPDQTPDQKPTSDQLFTVASSAIPLEKLSLNEGHSRTTKIHDARQEAVTEESARHRRLKTDAAINVESLDQTTSRTEPAVHSHGQVETNLLAEQLAAGLRAYTDDLSAGKPIELRLRLDPPELGMVRVHLRLADDVVSVRLIAGDEAATRILESQLPDLRQSLAERGLTFAQCDVHCDSGRHQQSTFGRDADVPFNSSPQSSANGWSRLSPTNHHVVVRSDRLDVLA